MDNLNTACDTNKQAALTVFLRNLITSISQLLVMKGNFTHIRECPCAFIVIVFLAKMKKKLKRDGQFSARLCVNHF